MTKFEEHVDWFCEHLNQLGYEKVVRCSSCARWARDDGMYKDFDGRQWHRCPYLTIATCESFYCSEAISKDD